MEPDESLEPPQEGREREQATVAAVFAWYSANWPEKLPRKAVVGTK